MNVFLERTFSGRQILKSQVKKFILKTTKGFYPAPLTALETVVKNYFAPLNEALEREAVSFGRLAVGAVSKNLISVFYLIEKYKKFKWAEVSRSFLALMACLRA